jgi:hypothetical protein
MGGAGGGVALSRRRRIASSSDALPSVVSALIPSSEVETLRQRLSEETVIPFLFMRDAGTALRTSNAVAAVMLFATGWLLGRYAGRPAWRTGLGMLAVGIGLVAITMALGG